MATNRRLGHTCAEGACAEGDDERAAGFRPRRSSEPAESGATAVHVVFDSFPATPVFRSPVCVAACGWQSARAISASDDQRKRGTDAHSSDQSRKKPAALAVSGDRAPRLALCPTDINLTTCYYARQRQTDWCNACGARPMSVIKAFLTDGLVGWRGRREEGSV
jgi:hypothetical protein